MTIFEEMVATEECRLDAYYREHGAVDLIKLCADEIVKLREFSKAAVDRMPYRDSQRMSFETVLKRLQGGKV